MTRDLEQAGKWLLKSAENGHVDAQLLLGLCHYEKTAGFQLDHERAFALFTMAAKQGSENGLFLVARCFEDGMGVDKDNLKALAAWKMAAKTSEYAAQVVAEYMETFSQQGISSEALSALNSVLKEISDTTFCRPQVQATDGIATETQEPKVV